MSKMNEIWFLLDEAPLRKGGKVVPNVYFDEAIPDYLGYFNFQLLQ